MQQPTCETCGKWNKERRRCQPCAPGRMLLLIEEKVKTSSTTHYTKPAVENAWQHTSPDDFCGEHTDFGKAEASSGNLV